MLIINLPNGKKTQFQIPSKTQDGLKRQQTEAPKTEPEIDRKIRYLFNKYDKDSSGSISRSEMTEVFQFLGIESTGPRADSAFQILDKDHSGKIEYSEFYDFFIIKLNPGPPPAPPKKTWKSHDYVRPGIPLGTVNKIKGSFDLFDEDNSGDITFQEAMAGWKYLQKDLTDEEGLKKFKLIDKDGSGTLDWEEFFDFFAERAAESIRKEKGEMQVER